MFGSSVTPSDPGYAPPGPGYAPPPPGPAPGGWRAGATTTTATGFASPTLNEGRWGRTGQSARREYHDEKIMTLSFALAAALSVSACQTPQQTNALGGGVDRRRRRRARRLGRLGRQRRRDARRRGHRRRHRRLIGSAATPQPTGQCARWGYDSTATGSASPIIEASPRYRSPPPNSRSRAAALFLIGESGHENEDGRPCAGARRRILRVGLPDAAAADRHARRRRARRRHGRADRLGRLRRLRGRGDRGRRHRRRRRRRWSATP